MTPEKKEAIKAHADAIAAILYKNTDVESLQSLEDIEQVVRQYMHESVTPQVGIFYPNKDPNHRRQTPNRQKLHRSA
jgi:hypothetical protein